MKIKCLALLICITAITACKTLEKNTLNNPSWLIGLWENKTSKGSIYEEWVPANEYELLGRSFAVHGKDTAVFEKIRLVNEAEGMFYIPAVSNQNEGKPVRFGLTSITDKKLIFENPDHDFPQVISYTLITQDSIEAQISGSVQGEDRKKQFPMKRIK